MLQQTYNHQVEHYQGHALCPIGFRVSRHVVDKKAGADKNSDFKKIFEAMFVLQKEQILVDQHTEKECEWFPSAPRKKNEERHPEKSELYADINGLPACERGWEGGLS